MRTTLFTSLVFLLISNAIADTEPNNDWQDATSLQQDSSVAGIQSDDDWYVINISDNQSVKRLLIDLTFSHADGNIDMEIYGDDFVSHDPAGCWFLFKNQSRIDYLVSFESTRKAVNRP